METFSLIVPVAGNKPEYSSRLPLPFTYTGDGIMRCVKAISGMDLTNFTDILFVILREHDERYGLRGQLDLQFGRLGMSAARVCVLDEPTGSQPETIARVIEQEHISGPVFIKDADCYFAATEVLRQNGIAIYPLEDLQLVDPQHKSYVAVDDMNYITNVIESRVVSRYFNAGGYCFEDAKEFCDYYARLEDYGHLYLSHIIYAMLLDGHIFRPIEISRYSDWTLERYAND